jgi:hypothetical protein
MQPIASECIRKLILGAVTVISDAACMLRVTQIASKTYVTDTGD